MRVFLIHGMGRTTASMWVLGRRLEAAGYPTTNFGYLVTVEPLERITRRFIQRVTEVLEKDSEASPSPAYAIIGHSLGNLITRQASPRLPEGFVRFVMLAPPNRSPALARALHDNRVFRWMTRDVGDKLVDLDFFAQLPKPEVPSLIIAGTRGPRSRWLPFDGRANDFILGVDETQLEGVPTLEVPGLHTFLMNRSDVFSAIRDFLATAAVPASAKLPRPSTAFPKG